MTKNLHNLSALSRRYSLWFLLAATLAGYLFDQTEDGMARTILLAVAATSLMGSGLMLRLMAKADFLARKIEWEQALSCIRSSQHPALVNLAIPGWKPTRTLVNRTLEQIQAANRPD